MTRSLACILAVMVAVPLFSTPQEDGRFSRSSLDIGVVVKDLEASARFYTEALGFTEVPGFSVPADFCTDAGLTDHHGLTVRVFQAGEGDTATRLKLMQVPAAKPKAADQAFIHSQLGISYLTVHVTDLGASLARAAKQGVTPLAKGPVPLDPNAPTATNLAVVRDPDGNLVELLGPTG